MKNLKLMAFAAFTLITISACSNDDDTATLVPVNEEEVITTVRAVLTPQGGGTAVTLTSRDLDGDGPNAPVNTVSGNFIAGSVYTGKVSFLNEVATPAEDITTEIEEEGQDHQLFYTQTGGNLGTFTYTDTDTNGNAIGLNFKYTAAATPAAGTLTITLIHQPDKGANGVAQGIPTNAGGSTDAQVAFAVTVVNP
jgi:hypothetical protein